MMPQRRIAVTIAMLSVTMLACGQKKAPARAPAAAATPVGADADSARRAADEAARRAAEDEAARRAAADEAARRAAAVTSEARAALTAPVHFDFDQSDLRSEDRAILD